MAERVLVTGGAGYIGSALVERLVRDGYDVTVFDNFMYGRNPLQRVNMMLSDDNVRVGDTLSDVPPGFSGSSHFRVVEGDVRDGETLKAVVSDANFDYVFHLAGLVGQDACKESPETSREINVGGMGNIVESILASREPPRLIYNSSSSVYRIDGGDIPLTEDAAIPGFEQLNQYCRDKVDSERLIREALDSTGDSGSVVFRPATVGGLSPRMRLELFPNFFTYAAVVKGSLNLSNPDHYRAVIGLGDLLDAYMAVLRGEWTSGTFNIGHLNMTKREFASEIGRIAGPFEIRRAKEVVDDRDLKISSQAFTDTYGFAPYRSLDETIGPLADMLRSDCFAFRSERHEDPSMVDPEFLNITQQQLKELLG